MEASKLASFCWRSSASSTTLSAKRSLKIRMARTSLGWPLSTPVPKATSNNRLKTECPWPFSASERQASAQYSPTSSASSRKLPRALCCQGNRRLRAKWAKSVLSASAGCPLPCVYLVRNAIMPANSGCGFAVSATSKGNISSRQPWAACSDAKRSSTSRSSDSLRRATASTRSEIKAVACLAPPASSASLSCELREATMARNCSEVSPESLNTVYNMASSASSDPAGAPEDFE
mmetsp:Transcript_44466/g.142555  ORF Transcript_44466/g.142555 Transcript_44466/m.142555 type:complete len:234 (+) Transcript_44466:436-1137(+)